MGDRDKESDIQRKQTTLVIIDEKDEPPLEVENNNNGGGSGGSNTYWELPQDLQPDEAGVGGVGPVTTVHPSNTYWDVGGNGGDGEGGTTTTMNPYWVAEEDEDVAGTTPSTNEQQQQQEEELNVNNDQGQGGQQGQVAEEGPGTQPETEDQQGAPLTSESSDNDDNNDNYPPPSAADYDPDADNGLLYSLRLYNSLRNDLAEDFVRPKDSNVDILTLPADGEQYAFCHLSAVIPFTRGDKVPFLMTHEDAAAIALAVQDLNTGNGQLVPEVEGLPDRCRIRFTTEWADTEFQGGVALSHVVNNLGRTQGQTTPQPCAFVGAWRSAVSIPTSIVTGLFGYPQISAGSTSADLDDPSQYPLFGRTIPADSGNAIPIIIYIRTMLQVTHLAVINVNDAYGNAYVEGMRRAAEIYAPDMNLHQIPLDEDETAIPNAVASLKATGYRYIFAVVFTTETHDQIMIEATAQGVAGTGLHNWLFGDSFLGTLERRTFEPNGVLANAYRGAGLLEVTGGVPGMEKFDEFQERFMALHNSPIDMELLGEMFPNHDYPEYNAKELYTGPDNTYLKEGVGSSFAPFMYEAIIGLGLAACDASDANPDGLGFLGEDHFEYFKNSSFTGFSGTMVMDEFASRDSAFALYKVTNYQEEFVTDEETGQEVVQFVGVTTDLFMEGSWNATAQQYIFNDGTTNLPPDLPPAVTESGTSTILMIIIPLCILASLAIGGYYYNESKRKKNDSVWVVSRDDIKFGDPPEIIGRGTFGLVLLGEYRGTKVAVKRVIPPKSQSQANADPGRQSMMASGMFDHRGSASGMMSMISSNHSNHTNSNHTGTSSGGFLYQTKGMVNTVTGGIGTVGKTVAGGVGTVGNTVVGGVNKVGSMVGVGTVSLALGKKRSTETEAQVWKRMKKEFMEEMRYLSKLRHPCITTVMGAVTTGEPMLIMEYMDHGSLYDLLHNETMAIEGELIMPLLKDMTQGIRFLHSADPQVIHGDLKSQNILVDDRFRAKVADFGLSQKQTLGGTGTPYWMAPELLRRESYNTAATDVFSFGIILYEVFARRDPYEGEDYDEVIKLVSDKVVQKRPPAPRHMPEAVKALMKDCVEDDPDKRPACDELDTRLKRIDAESINATQNQGKSAQVSLFDIFPRHIAEALRDGRTVEAEHKECVTIFFSDIVGFTTISSELEPRKVADMLDRLYTKFDALSNKHDIFKVETIGDAYMAVTNLVKDQTEDHAARIANFAIEAIAAANGTMIDREDEEKGCVNIRVGFHSGSVVADVVGTRNPRYCLFGDTVNTASRMESNSEVNRIHCSRAAAKLVQQQLPSLPIKNRGKVKIKGKGMMNTYWVNEGTGGHRGSSLISANSAMGLMADTSMDSSGASGDGGVRKRTNRKSPDSNGEKKNRLSRNFSTLLGKTPIDQISEAPSMEFSMRENNLRGSSTTEMQPSNDFKLNDRNSEISDIKEAPEAWAPEVVPEPTPFGAAGEP